MGRKIKDWWLKQRTAHNEAKRQAYTCTHQEEEEKGQVGSIPSHPILHNHIRKRHRRYAQQRVANDSRQYPFWKRRQWNYGKWNTIERFTFCLVVFTGVYALITFFQLRTMRDTLQAQQRAAVYIGTVDGKIGEIREQETPPKVFLYLHNYGQSAARRVVVEEWALLVDNNGFQGAVIPPRKLSWADMGPTIPPGGTWEIWIGRNLRSFTTEELDRRERKLWIIVRVLYEDAFGTYCDGFWLEYVGREVSPQQAFSLPTYPIADLCATTQTTIEFSYAKKRSDIHVDGARRFVEIWREVVHQWMDDW